MTAPPTDPETTHRPDANDPPRRDEASPYRAGVDDLDRLRRSSSDRKVAGVAGGMGRHFNLDPLLFRVLFVVLAFFGGSGLLLYGALWLLVPADGHDAAAVHTTPQTRKSALLAVLAVATLLAMGDSFGGWTFGWPLAIIAVCVALYLLVDRSPRTATTAASTPAKQSDQATRPRASASSTPPVTPSGVRLASGHQPYGPRGSRGPRRSGVILFWPTLALLAIGTGILGVYDTNNGVPDGAYAALVVATVGFMLLVGAVRGRPGGLIALGAVSVLALASNVAAGSEFGGDARRIHATPTTAAAVSDHYQAGVGEIRLDLTDVRDPEELAGRTIGVDLRTGHVHVLVPASLNLHVDASLQYAGVIDVPQGDNEGWNAAVDRHFPGQPGTDTRPLTLDLTAKFGQITVEHR